MPTKNITKWGVEIEAGWIPECGGPPNCAIPLCSHEHMVSKGFPQGWEIHHDGSIHVERVRGSATIPNEAVSPPLEDLDKLKEQMSQVWKLINRVNPSMGFHIHISMPRRNYYRLSSWDYVNFFQTKVRKDLPEVAARIDLPDDGVYRAEDTARINYCKAFTSKEDFTKKYNIQTKYREKHAERYTSINYAWSRFGTIEFRAFPMNKSYAKTVSYLDYVLANVDEYLEMVKEDKIRNLSSFDKDMIDTDSSVIAFNTKDHFKPELSFLTERFNKTISTDVIPPGVDKYKFKIGDKVRVVNNNLTRIYLTGGSIVKELISSGLVLTILDAKMWVSRDGFNGRRYYSINNSGINGINYMIDESDIEKAKSVVTYRVVFEPEIGMFLRFVESGPSERHLSQSILNQYIGKIGLIREIEESGESYNIYVQWQRNNGGNSVWLDSHSFERVTEIDGIPVPEIGSHWIVVRSNDTDTNLGTSTNLRNSLRQRTVCTATAFYFYNYNDTGRIYTTLRRPDGVLFNATMSDLEAYVGEAPIPVIPVVPVNSYRVRVYCRYCDENGDDTDNHNTSNHYDNDDDTGEE